MRASKSSILRLKKAVEGGNAMQQLAGGRRRIFTSQEDWDVSEVVKRNRNATPSQIPADLAIATGTHISARTISLPINQVGLHERKPVQCISLQPRYRRERLHWCKERIGWSHQQWSRVMFSDESRFTVTSDSGRQLLRKEGRTGFRQHYFVNLIDVTQVCWCSQSLCTMTEHRFTSLSEVTLHWRGIAGRLLYIMFVFLGMW